MKTTTEKTENREEMGSKMKLFVFGNSLVDEDSLAIRVGERLEERLKQERKNKTDRKGKATSAKNKGKKENQTQEIQIIRTNQPEDLLEEENPAILDVAKGITRVQLLQPSQLKQNKPFAAHDFDLQSFIQLAMRLGDLKGVKIIGIPMGYPLEKAVIETRELLQNAAQPSSTIVKF